jgi:hypothetical protein
MRANYHEYESELAAIDANTKRSWLQSTQLQIATNAKQSWLQSTQLRIAANAKQSWLQSTNERAGRNVFPCQARNATVVGRRVFIFPVLFCFFVRAQCWTVSVRGLALACSCIGLYGRKVLKLAEAWCCVSIRGGARERERESSSPSQSCMYGFGHSADLFIDLWYAVPRSFRKWATARWRPPTMVRTDNLRVKKTTEEKILRLVGVNNPSCECGGVPCSKQKALPMPFYVYIQALPITGSRLS